MRYSRYILPDVQKEMRELERVGGFDRLECDLAGPLDILDGLRISPIEFEIGIYGDNFGVSQVLKLNGCDVGQLPVL